MTTAQARKATLERVGWILTATSHPLSFAISPRVDKALRWVSPIILASLFLPSPNVGMLVAVIVFAVIWLRTPAETWEEQLCKLLMDYEPLDESSYQNLLSKIKDGTANRQAIWMWLRVENAHIERADEVAAVKSLLDTRLK